MYTKNSSRAIFVALVFSFFSTTGLFAQSCSHPDYPSLEKLYVATDGDGWEDNRGWLTDCEPCTWKGIGCDENQRVISINLRGNGLAGTLPSEIGDLDQLRRLNLAYNEVAGELPASLFSLASLRDINFSGNLFSGQLPSTLGDQPLLENLRLNNNQLLGQLPQALTSFTRMNILTLNNNGFTGAVPAGFGDLPFLFNLDISENDLDGCFPQDLETLCGNTRMRFGGNLKLSWSGDFSAYCSNGFDIDQVGAPCDDGNPDTAGDVISADCDCGGQTEPDGLVGSDQQTLGELPELEGPLQQPVTRSAFGQTISDANQEIIQMMVFPNPVVGDNISVRLPTNNENTQLRLLSLTGKVITHTTMNGPTAELTLPGLTAGVYMLEALTNGERSVQRIVVQ